MRIIKLQDGRIIQPPVGTYLYQDQSRAANVADSRFVLPFVRVMRDAANNKTSGVVTFAFAIAALLEGSDDSAVTGERFIDVPDTQLSVVIGASENFSGSGNNGKSYTTAFTGGKPLPIEHPGGLVIWRVKSDTASIVLKVEIDLVCR